MKTQDIPMGAPGSRRIVFGLFVLAFFMTCTIVLLYGSGYTIHFPSRSIIATGSLLIKTEPTDPTITVAGSVYSNATPLRVTRLIPRTVPVHIKKDGYFPWDKQLEIVRKQTTFVDTVLFRNTDPQVTNHLAPREEHVLTPDGSALLSYSPGSTTFTTTHANGAANTVSIHAPFVPSALHVWWNPDGTRALLQFTTASSTATHSVFYSLARPNEISPSVESFGYRPIRWNKGKPWLLEVRNALKKTFLMHSLTYEVLNMPTPADTTDAGADATPFILDDTQQVQTGSDTLYYGDHEVWYRNGTDGYALLLRNSDTVRRAMPVPNAPYAAVLTDHALQLIEYDARDGRNVYTLMPTMHVEDFALSKNGRTIIAVVRDGDKEERIQLPIR